MKRRLLAIPLLAISALVVAACSSPQTGTPTANPTTAPNQTGNGSSPTASGSGGGSDPLASVKPCSLLTPAQISQYNLTQSEADNALGARSCSWQGVPDGTQVGGEVDVDIYDHVGFQQLNNSQYNVSSFPLKQHQGYLEQGKGNDSCSVAIAVSSSSVINVDGQSSNGSPAASCSIAKQFAPIVEQNLIAMGH